MITFVKVKGRPLKRRGEKTIQGKLCVYKSHSVGGMMYLDVLITEPGGREEKLFKKKNLNIV